jgi:hypothetical protein
MTVQKRGFNPRNHAAPGQNPDAIKINGSCYESKTVEDTCDYLR